MELDESDWYPDSEKPKLSLVLRYQVAMIPGMAALRILATDGPKTGKAWGAQFGLSSTDCRQLGQHLLDAASVLEGMAGPKN